MSFPALAGRQWRTTLIVSFGIAALAVSWLLVMQLRPGIAAAQLVDRNSTCVSISAPASVVAGSTFSMTVTMRNTGKLTWRRNNGVPSYRLGSQNPQDNTRWGFGRIEMPANRPTVARNQTVTFAKVLTAPVTPGTYPLSWRMVQDTVVWFGATCERSVTVTPSLTIVGRVYNDTNGNGNPDAGESVIQSGGGAACAASAVVEGVRVVSRSGPSTVNASPNSCNPEAYYIQNNLNAGEYTLGLTVPAGWRQTTSHLGTVIDPVTLPTSHVWLGMKRELSIVGRVFEDANGNGGYDFGELFIQSSGNQACEHTIRVDGVQITGQPQPDNAGNATQWTTQPNGCNPQAFYTSSDLPSGAYRVNLVVPAGWRATTPVANTVIDPRTDVVVSHHWFGMQRFPSPIPHPPSPIPPPTPSASPSPTLPPTPSLEPTPSPSPTLIPSISPSPVPTSTVSVTANFLQPEAGTHVGRGTPLRVRLQMQSSDRDTLLCSQTWKLRKPDGTIVTLTRDNWGPGLTGVPAGFSERCGVY